MADPLTAEARFWPVDRLMLGYLAATGALIVAFWNRVPGAGWLAAAHLAGAAAIVIAARSGGRASDLFRFWYPLPYVAACYREMAVLIPALRGSDVDRTLAEWDLAIWGVHPTVWLERLQQPALTEFLQVAYSLFVPCVLLVPWLLWRRRRWADFRYCAFLIAAGFLVSYVGYLLAPARGPRFLLARLQSIELAGLWLYEPLRHGLDRLESAHWDCFPSGHVELTVLACLASRWISQNLFLAFSVYTVCVFFATVYLRYHYTVDVMAGVAVALILWVVAPHLYGGKAPSVERRRGRRG